MDYETRQDREIRRRMKMVKPYESRHALRRKYKVNKVVDSFASNLGKYGDASSYTPQFTNVARTENALLDKYYIPSHYPPRDVLTELKGLDEATVGKVKGTLLGLGAGILAGLATEALVDNIENQLLAQLATPVAASITTFITYSLTK